MKKIILILSLLPFLCAAQNVEVISSVTTYSVYQDSLLLSSAYQIVNRGQEGINDTLRLNSIVSDTASVVFYETNTAINDLNQTVSKFVNATPFRTVLSEYAAKKAVLATFNVNLDDRLVATYGSSYYGRYRIVGATTFDVDIAAHPTRTDMLRATGTNGEGNFNVQIFGAKMFKINLQGGYSPFLILDGRGGERVTYRRPSFFLPAVMFPEGADNLRVTKIR